MRLILSSLKSLVAVMSGSPATTQPSYALDLVEQPNDKEVTEFGSLTGATPLTLASSSIPKRVVSLAIANIDTQANVITLTEGLSGKTILPATTLAVGDTLQIDEHGVRVIDSNGCTKTKAGSVATVVTQEMPLEDARIWDAATVVKLGSTPTSADDLGFTAGTLGTSKPTLRTADGKNTTTNHKARIPYVVPSHYIAGQPLTIRVNAGMVTTVSQTSAVVDIEVYRRAAPTVDVNPVAAQSINSLTAADKDFALTATNIVPGETLDVLVSIAIVDSGTGTAVIGEINKISARPTLALAG
jgi:hypothetical protein